MSTYTCIHVIPVNGSLKHIKIVLYYLFIMGEQNHISKTEGLVRVFTDRQTDDCEPKFHKQ